MKKKQQNTPRFRTAILQWVLMFVGAVLAFFALQSIALWLPWRWAYEMAANASVWPIIQLTIVVGVGLVGMVIWQQHNRTVGMIYVALSVACVLPVAHMMLSHASYAASRQLPVSPVKQLDIFRNKYPADETDVKYGRGGQTDLMLSSYLTGDNVVPAPAVVYVHGGGWSGGSRTENSDFFRWLNKHGYNVFSIDYRLAHDRYASWQDAPRDVVCALAWLNSSATDQYHIDRGNVSIMGDSAGGQLALRAAYGIANDDLTSSCGGEPLVPRAVVGIVPAIDFVELYDDPRLGPTSRENVVRYLGGTPTTASEAYRESSIVTHVRAGLPRTLILNAANDTLVSPRSGDALAAKLREVEVRVEQYTLPYAVHSYWINPGGYQNQMSRELMMRFLAE